MEKIYFNIWPQLNWFILYYKTYYILILIFGLISIILLFTIIYKIFSLNKKIQKAENDQKELIKQIKSYYKKRLGNLEGKEFIKEFIWYIETVGISYQYQNIDQILEYIGVSKEDISKIKISIYKNEEIPEVIDKLKLIFK